MLRCSIHQLCDLKGLKRKRIAEARLREQQALHVVVRRLGQRFGRTWQCIGKTVNE